MKPTKYNLALYRGDTYAWLFVLWANDAKTEPLLLDGVFVKSEIRNKPGGDSIVSLVCDVELPNTIRVSINTLMWGAGIPAKGAWDLQLTWPDGTVYTPIAGSVAVTTDVTESTYD